MLRLLAARPVAAVRSTAANSGATRAGRLAAAQELTAPTPPRVPVTNQAYRLSRPAAAARLLSTTTTDSDDRSGSSTPSRASFGGKLKDALSRASAADATPASATSPAATHAERAAAADRALADLPSDIGHVVDMVNEMVTVRGLVGAVPWSVVRFESGAEGVVVDLKAYGQVTVALLADATTAHGGASDIAGRPTIPRLATGEQATLVSLRSSVPVGVAAEGRVVDPLGRPLDGGAPIASTATRVPLQLSGAGVPQVADCAPSWRFMPSRWKVVDAFYPIGYGRSTAITGASGPGKRQLALDVMEAQLHARSQQKAAGLRPVHVVYVVVGKSGQALRALTDDLAARGLSENTTVVAAPSTASAAMQYLAPFAGAAIAEHYRDAGGHALIVYDDLCAHALAAKRLSPMGTAPPMHGALLSRCAQLSAQRRGGSLTALALADHTEATISDNVLDDVARARLVEQISSFADDTLHLHDGELLEDHSSGTRQHLLPVNFESLTHRAAHAFQPKALRTYVQHAHELLVQLRGIVRGAQDAYDMLGLEPETDVDKIMDLHARMVLMLAPTPHATRLAAEAGTLSRAELTVRNMGLGHGLGPAFREGAADGDRASVAGGHRAGEAGAMPVNKEALFAAREEKRRRMQEASEGRLKAMQGPRGGEAARAEGTTRAAGPGARGGSDGGMESPARAEPAQLLVTLFALTHGYASSIPIEDTLAYERGLWELVSTMPAPAEAVKASLEARALRTPSVSARSGDSPRPADGAPLPTLSLMEVILDMPEPYIDASAGSVIDVAHGERWMHAAIVYEAQQARFRAAKKAAVTAAAKAAAADGDRSDAVVTPVRRETPLALALPLAPGALDGRNPPAWQALHAAVGEYTLRWLQRRDAEAGAGASAV